MVAPALVGMAEAFARRWHELGEQYAIDDVARLLATLWLRAVGVAEEPRARTGAAKGARA